MNTWENTNYWMTKVKTDRDDSKISNLVASLCFLSLIRKMRTEIKAKGFLFTQLISNSYFREINQQIRNAFPSTLFDVMIRMTILEL